MPVGQLSFEAYRLETENYIRNNREFVSEDRDLEVSYNAPREWRPKGVPAGEPPAKGILLVHGLGDSPWSFTDLGPALAGKGFLARAVLLPGCGTNPEDMMVVTVDDWRRVVAEQAEMLGSEVGELYLGGFSNGANLVLEYAHGHPEVKGLALFSPAFKSGLSLDFLAPLVSVFKDWVISPRQGHPVKDERRYGIVPANAFAQFYYASASARRLLMKEPFDRPVVIVLSERDSVLDVPYLIGLFKKSFTNPRSRLIYYGRKAKGPPGRSYFRPDYLPEWRVSNFSHMGVMFSPANPDYGFNGLSPLCENGQEEVAYRRCLEGEEVWGSAWGYVEEGKTHARLTFNPYFDWQLEIVLGVLGIVD
ncbi:MAG: alpha/beta fold hydrolase [Deltaproteobacteria bacterium]|nr:alpha/beta fold hydrolase [Deltaproteobacteria bacterium]